MHWQENAVVLSGLLVFDVHPDFFRCRHGHRRRIKDSLSAKLSHRNRGENCLQNCLIKVIRYVLMMSVKKRKQ